MKALRDKVRSEEFDTFATSLKNSDAEQSGLDVVLLMISTSCPVCIHLSLINCQKEYICI